MFNNIPQSRMILYLMILGLFPVVFSLMILKNNLNNINELENAIEDVKQQALLREQRQSLNMIVWEHFKESDHFYVDKHLETLSFLEPEVEELQKLVNNKNFAGDENVKKRLEFLTGSGNNLLLSEGSVQAYPFFQETAASLAHPIEVNLEDLKELLALIEGQTIGPYKPGPGRPQLIITDFKIDRKEATEGNEVLLLNLKILKREYS